MAHPASLSRYPAERVFLGRGTTASFGLHLLAAGIVVALAFFAHIKTIQQLMEEGGAIAQSGPAPDDNIEVELRPPDLPPPPPTVNPEFVKQIELPKPAIIPPPPVPVIPPKPKPAPLVKKPRYTAAHATGTGESASVSKLVLGSSGFPRPGYPYEARLRHQSGTVLVGIQFDSNGRAANVEIEGSSGVSILDASTRSFIQSHWSNGSFAGRRVTVPIDYEL